MVNTRLSYEPLYGKLPGDALHSRIGEEIKPEIIILDSNLSGIDGIKVCRQIRELALEKYIYVLMLTSLRNEAHRELAINTGVDIYMTKPFEVDGLISSLQELSQRQNQPS